MNCIWSWYSTSLKSSCSSPAWIYEPSHSHILTLQLFWGCPVGIDLNEIQHLFE